MIPTFLSYAIERRVSKTPEKFGTGMISLLRVPTRSWFRSSWPSASSGFTRSATAFSTSGSCRGRHRLHQRPVQGLAADNILVNTVCIGYIKSGQHERRFAQAAEASVRRISTGCMQGGGPARHSARPGRRGSAGADVIAFRPPARASYITGVADQYRRRLSAVV
jgi:hypothetical protein